MSRDRRKRAPTPFDAAPLPRALAPSDRRSALPTAFALRALLGVGLAGGLTVSCTETKDKVTADQPRRPASAISVAAAPSESAPCAASEHVEPHIAPNADNDIGGKMVAVKPTVKPVLGPGTKASGAPKCPPGDPLCN